MHCVRVDMSRPEIGVYVTPVDPEAAAGGFQYRLSTARAVARKENLAVVVNGGLFSSQSGYLPATGDWARGIDTVVSEHEVSHVYPYNYLLWFEDDLTPHIATTKPPPHDVLKQARFGIGSQLVVLAAGKVSAFAGHEPDRRTAVGVDTQRKLIWLAAFEHASGTVVAKTLAAEGARDAALLDGGDSTTMFIARTNAPVRTGTLAGGHRPVATFVGIRAESLGFARGQSHFPSGKIGTVPELLFGRPCTKTWPK